MNSGLSDQANCLKHQIGLGIMEVSEREARLIH